MQKNQKNNLNEEASIDFGNVYLASEIGRSDISDPIELYLLVVRDAEKTLRQHGKIYLSPLEEGAKPFERYCVNVIDGKFVDLRSDPEGATPDQIKKLQLIGRLSEEQKIFFKEILEGMESQKPGRIKYY